MKKTLYSHRLLHVVFMMVVFLGWQSASAQCGTASAYVPTVNSQIVCSGNQVYIKATGLPVISWIYRDSSSGSWTAFSSNADNASQYVYPDVVTTRTYKAVVGTLACPSDTTLGIDVTLMPPVYGVNASIKISGSSNQTCSGNSVVLRLMNQGIQPIAWLYRDNGGVWSNYLTTTTQNITATMPNVTTPLVREFCALVKNSSNCSVDSTDSYAITVSPSVSGVNPNIYPYTNNPTICGGNSAVLQVDWPLEIGDWLYKDAGSSTWQVISSGTAAAYDFNTNIAVSGIREYRVVLENSNNCSADTSGAYRVMINASQRRVNTSIQPRISGSNTTVCAGSSMSFQLPGYTNISNWMYRDSSTGNWTLLSSSTTQTISSSSFITTDIVREVRVVINNSVATCSYDTSAPVFYTIKAFRNGNTTSAIPYTTSSELCVGASPIIYLGNGLTVSSWLHRTNQTGAWYRISSGSSFTDYNTSSFTANTVRSYRAIVTSASTCRSDTTPEIQILYKMPVPGGVVSITPVVNQPSYCGGGTITGSIPLTNSQQVAKWMYRDVATGIWYDVPYSNNAYLFDYNTNITGSVTRSYCALILSLETFSLDTSKQVLVEINNMSRGNIAVTPTSTNAAICNDNTLTISVVPPADYAVNHWISRDTVSSDWINSGYSSNTYSSYVSTANNQRYFRVVLFNQNLCRYDTSNTLTMTVRQKIGRNNFTYLPTTSSASICSGTTFNVSISLPAGTSVSRWIYRDNGSAWREILSTASSYVESGANTKVLVPTLREYKAIVVDNINCFNDTSSAVSVSINPFGNGTYSGITPTTSTPTVCAGSGLTASFTYAGTVQKWMFRDNGAAWQEFTNTTSSTNLSDINTYVPALTNREYRALLLRQNSCLIDTTQILSAQLKPMLNGTAGALQPTTPSATICSGSTLTLTVNVGTGNLIQKWIVSKGTGNNWNDLLSSSGNTIYNEYYTSVAATETRRYRAIIQTASCSYDTSLAVSVQINPRSYGYSTATTLSSSVGVFCSGYNIPLNVVSNSIPSGASVRSWMYMDNMSGQWIHISNTSATTITHSNTTVQSPTTRGYRIVVNNTLACSYDSSNIFSVTINPTSKGYATTITPIISNSIVCNASLNPTLSVSLPSGYLISKWVVNNNGTGWTDFAYPTASSNISDFNTAVQIPIARSYRAIVKNANLCSVDSSNIVHASINPAVRGVLPIVTPTSPRSTYCYTKTIQVNVSAPAGYNIEKWIYNDNNTGWFDCANSSTSSVYSDYNTFVSTVTSRAYRVIMLNNTSCQRDTTAELSVIINPRGNNTGLRSVMPTANPVSGICAGSSVSLTVSPGTGNDLIKWTYSDQGNAGPWYDAVGSIFSSSFTHQLTQVTNATTRLYRAVITDTSTCDFDSTQSVAVNITPITYGTDTTIAITAADSVCVGSPVSLGTTPGLGNSVVKWMYRDNNSEWKNFVFGTQLSSFTDNNILLPVGSTRGYTALILKNTICRIDTLTKVKDVYFKNKTYGNSLTSVIIGSDTICAGSSLSISTSGTIEYWLFRDGANGTWTSIQSATTNLTHTETGVLSSGWRYYAALLNTGSCYADTTMYDSVYIKALTKGNIAWIPVTSNSFVCAGNPVAVNLSAPGTPVQRWLYRDNGVGPWNILSTSTSLNVMDYATLVPSAINREYRAIIFRSCSYDTTNSLTVTITPKTNATDITKVPTATSNVICAASTVQGIQVAAGAGNTIVQWLSRDNGGAWQVFASGNVNNLTDYNTNVTTTVVRDYVAIINNNSVCRLDTSARLSVTINAIVLGNSTNTVTAPANGCMGSQYSVSLNVSGDTSILRFLSSYNGGSWTDEGYLTPSASASLSRYANNGSAYTIGYRALMYKSGNCHIDTTEPVTVSVVPRTYGNDNTIVPVGNGFACSGYSFNVSVVPGAGNTIAQWIYSDDGTTWIPYYSTSSSITQTAYTSSSYIRQYRALIVKGSICSIDTSAATSIIMKPIVNSIDSSAQVTVSSGSGVCLGSSISISVSTAGYTVNGWLYRDNGGLWNPIYSSSGSITHISSNVSTSVDREYATLIWKAGACRLDTTMYTDTVSITPRTNGNDNSISITPNNTTICVGNSVTLTAAVGSNFVQTWYYRDNGGAWKVLTSAVTATVTDYNTGVLATTTRDYRALIRKSNVCAFDTSASTTVTINPRIYGSDMSIVPSASSGTICSGSMVTVSVSPGGGNTIERWIYRDNGGAWVPFANFVSSTIYDYNTHLATATTREYKAIVVKSLGCSFDTTASVIVNISPSGFGNQSGVVPVTTQASICSGSNVTVSVGGFSGSSVSHWLYRDFAAEDWSVFYSSATTITDFNTQTNSIFTRQYRAIINNTSGCSTDTTASVSVTVSPLTNGVVPVSTMASVSSVCSGNPINVFINPPAGSTVASWLYTNESGDWNVLNTFNATSINDFNTGVSANTTRMYRAILRSSAGCSLDSANTMSVNINVITEGANLAIIPNTTTPQVCSGSTAIVGVSGFSGTILKWLYRDSIVDEWSTILSPSFTLFDMGTFVSYTRTRTYRAIVYNSNICSYDTTAEVQLQIIPQLAGNANNITPTSPVTKACEGSNITLSATGFINGGVVVGWIYSDNGMVWNQINGASGENATHVNVSVNGPTTRQYRALVLTGCSTDTTAALSILLDKYPTKPSIVVPAGTDSLICLETAVTYEWRLNGNIIPGADQKVHKATVSGVYNVVVGNAAGCKTTSDNFTHGMVGLSDVFANTVIQVFPNPTLDGLVQIGWEGLVTEQVHVSVMDMLGRVVLEKEVDVAGQQGAQLDLSNHTVGIYFVTLSAEGNTITRKVLYRQQ